MSTGTLETQTIESIGGKLANTKGSTLLIY